MKCLGSCVKVYNIKKEIETIMPQLVKGGKYVFGWSVVGADCRIVIPAEAMQEYRLDVGERVILMSGSATSGGFSVAKKSVLEQSKLADILKREPQLNNFEVEEGQVIHSNGRDFCRVTVHENDLLILSAEILAAFGVKPGDSLLVIRGSYVGIGMAVKGPLLAEAKKHSEIAVFSTDDIRNGE
jgi:bifunctional DNA-binding transcriptional regulator/antitoxin component of YhaV-PrlF toxin-antitoxin module